MNAWKEWERRQKEKLQAKRTPAKKLRALKEPIAKRSITADELRKIKGLRKVRPAWWCGDGRFVEQFKGADTETQITERQAQYIQILWYKYRRQLGHDGPRPEGYE
jgi:hypothetical protein